jgi:hypothetical protein
MKFNNKFTLIKYFNKEIHNQKRFTIVDIYNSVSKKLLEHLKLFKCIYDY